MVSARPPDWTPSPGVPCRVVQARDGEHDKTLDTVAYLCQQFAEFRLSSQDAVISCGRRDDDRRRGPGRGPLPPGCAGRAHPDHAAGPGRREHRRQDGRQPARGQEPDRGVTGSRVRCSATPSTCRRCPAGSSSTAPVNSPGATSSAPRTSMSCPCSTRSSPASSLKASIVAAAEHHPDLRHIELRPHPWPRPRAGHDFTLRRRRGRRHRHGVCRSPGPGAGPDRRGPGRPSTSRSRGYGLPIALPAERHGGPAGRPDANGQEGRRGRTGVRPRRP